MMNARRTLSTVLIFAAPTLWAAGIDRSGQSLGVLLEDGNQIEFAQTWVRPHVAGTDLAGGTTGRVTGSYVLSRLSGKIDLTEKMSMGFVVDQPYGGKLLYGVSSPLLGGTRVDEKSLALLGLARYRLNPSMSVHGGLRVQRSSATIVLSGLAYGPVSGYQIRLEPDTATGLVAGAAYEASDIGLRLSVTYHQAVRHQLDSIESGPLIDPDGAGPAPSMALLNGESITPVSTPHALNIDFQMGLASDTLLFGQWRWVRWSEFRLDPTRFVTVAGEGLLELRNSNTITLGLAHQFNPRWAGVLALEHEGSTSGMSSPLSPANGRKGITLAAIHKWAKFRITAGVSYSKLGDAVLETGTPDVMRARTQGNSSTGMGVQLGIRF